MNEEIQPHGDHSRRFWDVANIITGFSVAQSLGYLYLVGGNPDFYEKIAKADTKIAIIVVTIVFDFVYFFLIYQCRKYELAGLVAPNKKVMEGISRAAHMRVVAIAAFSGLAIWVTAELNVKEEVAYVEPTLNWAHEVQYSDVESIDDASPW